MKIRQKTGGRIAGTPNRITAQVRSLLTCVLEAEIENLPKLLEEVPPTARLTAVLKLTELLCPPTVHWDCLPTNNWETHISFIPEVEPEQEL